jgi:S-adenosylmethionine/arginine decarboxylase-like enzyme
MLFHKHLLVNAKIVNPMREKHQAVEFLNTLVERINMKKIDGPFAHYIAAPGNEGLTAVVMIETSHIAFHIWDRPEPAMLQFDLYTCGSLDTDVVFNTLEEYFYLVEIDYKLIDREVGFVTEDEGTFSF